MFLIGGGWALGVTYVGEALRRSRIAILRKSILYVPEKRGGGGKKWREEQGEEGGGKKEKKDTNFSFIKKMKSKATSASRSRWCIVCGNWYLFTLYKIFKGMKRGVERWGERERERDRWIEEWSLIGCKKGP